MNHATLRALIVPFAAAMLAGIGCAAPAGDLEVPSDLEGNEPVAEASQSHQTCITVRRGGGTGDVQDAKLRADRQDTNMGAETTFVTGSQVTRRAALLRFDMPIPAGQIIDSATVTLHEVSSLGPSTIDVHTVTAAWGESTATWNNFGEAYSSVAAGHFSNGGAGVSGAVTFDVTTLAQAWYSGPNHGIALRASTDTTWASSEAVDEARRPTLTVCHSPEGR